MEKASTTNHHVCQFCKINHCKVLLFEQFEQSAQRHLLRFVKKEEDLEDIIADTQLKFLDKDDFVYRGELPTFALLWQMLYGYKTKYFKYLKNNIPFTKLSKNEEGDFFSAQHTRRPRPDLGKNAKEFVKRKTDYIIFILTFCSKSSNNPTEHYLRMLEYENKLSKTSCPTKKAVLKKAKDRHRAPFTRQASRIRDKLSENEVFRCKLRLALNAEFKELNYFTPEAILSEILEEFACYA